MKSFFVLLLLAFVAHSTQLQLKLSVYYESLCPDSRRFIINQLYPTLKLFGGLDNEYFVTEFVPYGKANTTFNGTFEFECQHGDDECLGNMIHACALAKLEKSESAALINCMMTSFDPPEDGQPCAEQIDVDYTRVAECYDGWEGPTLLAANGIKTHDLDPPLYYVPWITYNDAWTEEDMKGSETNLLNVLCNKFVGIKPEQCRTL